MTRSTKQGRGAGLVLGGVGVLSVGVLVGILTAPEVAAGTEDDVVPTSIPVVVESFDDERQMSFAPYLEPGVVLGVEDYGRVTRTQCAIGSVIESGTSPMTVEDRPLLALATEIPLWRDLAPGSRGEDVRALQSELVRLGFEVPVDGTFRASTRSAVQTLLRDAGVDRPGTVLETARVLWLPRPEVVMAECGVTVGAMTGTEPFGRTSAQVTALRRTGETGDLVSGDRVARFAGLTAPVDETGLVTDEGLLAAVADSPLVGPELGGDSVMLDYALAVPLEVITVPPSAVFGAEGDRGCVVADGIVSRVRIVASQFGRTMVALDGDGAVPGAVDPRPDPGLGCS